MNKRQTKKQKHNLCVKYQDGYGVMPMLRNPSTRTGNIITDKMFNDNIFLQHEGIDFSVDMFNGKAII